MKNKCILYNFIIILALSFLVGCGKDEGRVERVSISQSTVSDEGVSINTASDNSVSEDSVVQESFFVDYVSANEASVSQDDIEPETVSYNDATSEYGSLSADEVQMVMEVVDSISENAIYYNSVPGSSMPTGMSGLVTTGYSRDIFFANGTPIEIKEPNTDVSEYVHASDVQEALANGLGPDNRGYGAVIIWRDTYVTKYVVVSNMCEVFGGSYNADLMSDATISIDGSEARRAYPNVSFVFGGSMNGDLIGNVSIKVQDGSPLYLYGGGYNGSVYGDVSITYAGLCATSDIVGGGLAYPNGSDALSLIDGNVFINISCSNRADANLVAGGGYAYNDSEYAAIADVTGHVVIYGSTQGIYELCGGGLAVAEGDGPAISNVYGDVQITAKKLRLLAVLRGDFIKPGLLYAGGMSSGGVAEVLGDASISENGVVYTGRLYGVTDINEYLTSQAGIQVNDEVKAEQERTGERIVLDTEEYDRRVQAIVDSVVVDKDAYNFYYNNIPMLNNMTFLDPLVQDVAIDKTLCVDMVNGVEYRLLLRQVDDKYVIYIRNLTTGELNGMEVDITDDMLRIPNVLGTREAYSEYQEIARRGHIPTEPSTSYQLTTEAVSLYRPQIQNVLLWR